MSTTESRPIRLDHLAKSAQLAHHNGEPQPDDAAIHRLWDDIRTYDLAENIAELELWGLTIVPPEKAAPAGFTDRLREATIAFITERDGAPLDFENGDSHRNQALGDYHYMLLHDPVFQEMLLQPVALTLLTYLLGEGAIVHANSALCKGPHEPPPLGGELVLGLHTDNQLMPAPFHQHAEICNITWPLTDYTKDNGALAYVPASHLLRRHPNPGEGLDRVVPVECPAGSIICWHGNTWHGAYRRTEPGLRLSVGSLFSRPHIWPRHPLREDVTDELIERNGPRFATLCGRRVQTGWRESGPDYLPEYTFRYPNRYA